MKTAKRTPVPRHPGLYSYLRYGKKAYGFVVDGDRLGSRRQITRQGFTSIEAAEVERAKLRYRRVTGDVVESSRELLSVFGERWLEAKALSCRASTMRQDRYCLRRVVKYLGDRPLGGVRPEHVQAMVTAMVTAKYSAVTIRHSVRLLGALYATAVDWRLVARTPVAGVKVPPVGTKERPPLLSLADMRAIGVAADTDGDEWGLIFRVLIETWMRRGELLDLRWGAIDVEAGVIRIERGMEYGQDGMRSGPGKSASARRVITVSPELADRLRVYRDQERFYWGKAFGPMALVFPDHETGSWMGQNWINRALARYCRSLGLPVVTPHWLRHSGISQARLAGKDIVTISKRAGHSNPTMTYGVYSHTDADEEGQLGRDFGRLVTGS